MADAITIDNLPIETSVHWAQAQEGLERAYFQDSLHILYQTEIAVAEPKYDQLVLLFEQNKKAPTWAGFSPPLNFYKQSNRFFYKNLVPNVDPSSLIEKYALELERLQTASFYFPPESSEKLSDFLEVLETLNALLWEIRSRMLQYRKG